MTEQTFVFYTSRLQGAMKEDRWAYTGTPDISYHTYEEARAGVMAMLKDIAAEPDETPGVQLIERIETLPITRDTLLALLNDGVGAVLKSYEIVETVG
ncbi:hypothetical protein [Rhizobium binxianense]|uniref:hypothetical protein n=1 Tax=Rhizobium binxianense TaxID=3024242 RepID=UPI0023608549|nr:hypothetical protein [Rhizobium sp. MC62]MDC9813924.1 hypothetical protein [Rhizobium sp. MC62]